MRYLLCLALILLGLNSCQENMGNQPIESQQTVEEIVVIGGGLMGSSTTWELSKYGQDVLLIEQQDSVYSFGSSFGEARISRSLGPKQDVFSFLQQSSVSETKKLIDFLNEGVTEDLHSMEDIYTTSPVTYIYSQSQLNDIEALLDGQTEKYEYARNPEEANNKFGMKISDTSLVIREYKQYSGTLNPKVLIQKLHQGIRKSGNRVSYNQKVTSLTKEDGLYKIVISDTKAGNDKTIFSKKVVAAAGPYNGTLVKELAPYFSSLIRPKRLFLSFIKINADKYNGLTSEQKERLQQSYPVAYLNDEIFYSMIENYDENDHPLIKVGGHFLRTDIEDLDKVWEIEISEEEIAWSKENTADYLAKLNLPIELEDLEYERGYSCVYSLTPSETPYVTQVLDKNKTIDSSFVLVGGMSGVGAKGALTYGLIAADLLLEKENESFMYQKTKKALGVERLLEDIESMDVE